MITIKYIFEFLSLVLLSCPATAQEDMSGGEEVYFQEVFEGAAIQLEEQVALLTEFSKIDFSSEAAKELTNTSYVEYAEGEDYYEEVFRANDIALEEQVSTLTSFTGMTSQETVLEEDEIELENDYHSILFDSTNRMIENQVNSLTSFGEDQNNAELVVAEQSESYYKNVFKENDLAIDAQLENLTSFTKMDCNQSSVKEVLSEDLEEINTYHQAVFGKTEINLKKQVAVFSAFTSEEY